MYAIHPTTEVMGFLAAFFVSAGYIFNTIIDIIGASITIAVTILIVFVILFRMSGD